MQTIKLTEKGLERVLNGSVGMTFVVDSFTDGVKGKVAHVRDYRIPQNGKAFQIWSISADGYELIRK
jgi:hypothetical protein